MVFLTISIALVTIILYLINNLVRGGRRGKLIDEIPGPYAWPMIGNTIQFMAPPDKLWNLIRKLNTEYHPINRVWIVIGPIVNILHPDDVEALLSNVKHIEKSFLYNFLHPWLKTGLLTSKGAKWRQRRKILTPAFHFNVLRQFAGIFIEQSDKMVESLCLEGDEVVDDLVALLHKYTLNSICESAMGFKSQVDGKVLREYRNCVSDMGEMLLYRAVRPWLYVDWIFEWFSKFKEQVRVLKVLHGFSTNIIKERKQYHKETDGRFLKGLGSDGDSNLHNFYEQEHVKGKRRLAMLDLLISASQRDDNLDDEGIREEVDTFVFEGHDTTAMALCCILMLLAENKEIQEKARAEVDEVLGGRGKKFTIKEIQSLPYVERCIKESLRLFPSVPFISRRISEDLKLNKFLIPGGTMVNIPIWELHRNADFWPDPEVFDPDRFLPENVRARHPFAYIPFSAGPRNCIGQKFAMLELKALIANLLHNFYLEPIDFSNQLQILSDLILRPMNPIRMKIIRILHND